MIPSNLFLIKTGWSTHIAEHTYSGAPKAPIYGVLYNGFIYQMCILATLSGEELPQGQKNVLSEGNVLKRLVPL